MIKEFLMRFANMGVCGNCKRFCIDLDKHKCRIEIHNKNIIRLNKDEGRLK